MYTTKSLPGLYQVDGQTVHLDSKSEAIFMRRLVKNGFSDKWRRPNGVAYASHQYTPDFELSVEWHGEAKRAHVEYKPQSATQFTMDRRQGAIAALHFYDSNPLLLLYVGKTKRWYYIDQNTKHAISCAAPISSKNSISVYPMAKSGISITNKYGRHYKSDTNVYIANKVADGLQFGINLFFGSPKKRKSRKKY